ncbi:MAG: type II 3-dehydroquinate dehydratase [Opitutales bacterium]|nr:type II 3-dehydroquinate dehydratase [Opitutales bacterium]
MKRFLILNGPNLNRLGKREPGTYGAQTLAELEAMIRAEAAALGVDVRFCQSNHEGVLVDAIHEAEDDALDGIVFNPAAYTHTSVALRDAISAVKLPVVEVHISNVHSREEFRHRTLTGAVSRAVISGLGFEGYLAALRFLAK